jgi:hypothetical protein
MALSQSALSELLEAFRVGDGAGLIRDSVRVVLQELIELEASERIGADRYERTDTRVTDPQRCKNATAVDADWGRGAADPEARYVRYHNWCGRVIARRANASRR